MPVEPAGAAEGVQGLFNRKLVLEEETAVFILVNFADVILTALVFRYGGWEVNPFAQHIIRSLGIMGLAFYKFALVTFVILITQYVYGTHPKTARWVLIFGSIMYGILAVGVTITLFRHVFSEFS